MKEINNKEFMTALLRYLKDEFKHQIRNGVYGYTSRELAYHSNKIEGSTLTKEQTASLFDTQAIVSTQSLEIYKTKDVEEANGYKIGEYKDRANMVSDIITAKPEEVHERISELLSSWNRGVIVIKHWKIY